MYSVVVFKSNFGPERQHSGGTQACLVTALVWVYGFGGGRAVPRGASPKEGLSDAVRAVDLSVCGDIFALATLKGPDICNGQ